MFDRCVVINLDRRPDRWEAFCERLPRPWPLVCPERFAATDGVTVEIPRGWKSGPGAYGCLISHMTAWEEAAAEEQSLLVFEDDATFCPNFTAELESFLGAVPNDWDMIYLGGQHVVPPERKEGCWIGRGIKKSHAYAVRGGPLRCLPAWLRIQKNHMDVELSLLHPRFRVYCPPLWLCGQTAGRSDILCGSVSEPERWFGGHR